MQGCSDYLAWCQSWKYDIFNWLMSFFQFTVTNIFLSYHFAIAMLWRQSLLAPVIGLAQHSAIPTRLYIKSFPKIQGFESMGVLQIFTERKYGLFTVQGFNDNQHNTNTQVLFRADALYIHIVFLSPTFCSHINCTYSRTPTNLFSFRCFCCCCQKLEQIQNSSSHLRLQLNKLLLKVATLHC